VFYVWLWQILSWRVSLSSNRFHCLIMWLLTYSNIYVIICAFVCGPSLCCSSLEISRTAVASHRHVNFMHICDCHTDSLIAAFFLHISANCAYRIFFCINWHFRRHFNIICVSIRFRYLDHLVANRMAPSMCPDSRGTRWSSWF